MVDSGAGIKFATVSAPGIGTWMLRVLSVRLGDRIAMRERCWCWQWCLDGRL